MTHSPLPWKWGEFGDLVDANERVVGAARTNHNSRAHVPIFEIPNDEDRAFIVRACNSHDDLLEAHEGIAVFVQNIQSVRNLDGYVRPVEALGFSLSPKDDKADFAQIAKLVRAAIVKAKETK